MGVKTGMLITAVGLAVALHAYRKNKASKQSSSISGTGKLAAGAATLGAGAYAVHSLSNNHSISATPAATVGRSQLTDPTEIYFHLLEGILDKGLESFYGPQTASILSSTAQEIAASGKLAALADRFDLPNQFALDLVRLALYDIVLLVDDSGSMSHPPHQKEMLEYVAELASVASLFDSNGIEVRFMNSNDHGNGITNENAVSALLSRNPPQGRTPLGASLRDKILKPMVLDRARSNQLRKPVLVMVFTDGAATDQSRDEAPVVIENIVNELARIGKRNAVFFSFAQVGADKGAIDYLSDLDSDKRIGHLIDVTSNPQFEMQQVLKSLDKVKSSNGLPQEFASVKNTMASDSALWATLFRLKRLVGGIASWYDQSDEKKTRRWSGSGSVEYKAHWSEQPGFKAKAEAAHKSKGYPPYSGPAGSASFNGNASLGGTAPYNQRDVGTSPGLPAQNHSYGSQQPYGSQPPHGAPSSYGNQPLGNTNFQSSSPYPTSSNSPYPPPFNNPYPPADNGYGYPATANSNPYPPIDYNQQPFYGQSGAYPPQQPQQSQFSGYPPANGGFTYGSVDTNSAPSFNPSGGPPQQENQFGGYPPQNNGQFSGGFGFPQPGRNQY